MAGTKRDIKLVECTARITPITGMATERELQLASRVEEAGGPPLITDGHPTIARVVAWLCHEGVNRNGLCFVKEELPAAAAKIQAPNLLPMDFNHSATASIDADVQRAIGVWYQAEYAFDPQACDGKGAWGILATGMMWAWMNPDYANQLLLDQERLGAVRFSMACIPGSSEYLENPETPGMQMEIAHNPIFFTLSALNIPGADPDAVGIVSEGDLRPDLENMIREHLKQPTVAPHPMDDATNMPDPIFYHVGDKYTDQPGSSGVAPHKDNPPSDKTQPVPQPIAPNVTPGPIPSAPKQAREILQRWAASLDPAIQEAQMDELTKLLESLASKNTVDEMKASLAELKTMIESALAEAKARADDQNDDDEDDKNQDGKKPDYVEKSQLDAAVAELDTAKGRIAELETALEAAKTELTNAAASMSTLEAKIAEQGTKLAAFETAEQEAVKAALLKTRIASLPASYREAHEKRADRADVEARWMRKDDQEWTDFVADLSLPTMRKSYLERSEEEGRLPGGAPGDSDVTKSLLAKYE